jgi:hypothetical protein
MNDSDTVDVVRDSLITAKDSLAGVHASTPLVTIVMSGRARRRRHRLAGLTGGVAVIAGMALAGTVLASAGHPAGQSVRSGRAARNPVAAQLAAWTVDRQSNGDIKITIRELSDPSGLQSTLRADGLPANVTSSTQFGPSCQPYPMSQALFISVYHAEKGAGSGNTVLVINPSALPGGEGVQIGASVGGHAGDGSTHHVAGSETVHKPVHHVAAQGDGGNGVVRVRLVYASQQCTGS